MTLEELIDYHFSNGELLKQALTHKSYHNENVSESSGHNERLEFLGDAVLDLALSQILMDRFPGDAEGSLSKKRASLVNETILAKVAEKMDLGALMLLGKGEKATGGAQKPRLLSSVFEALLGAVVIDGGYEVCSGIIKKQFAELIEELNNENLFFIDYKTEFQEMVQNKEKLAPIYKLVGEKGPAHYREFEVQLMIGDRSVAKGKGRSKKQAEQAAAQVAMEEYQ